MARANNVGVKSGRQAERHAKIGREMMHLAPSVVSSSNQISPPIRSITSLATERPSPVPLSDAVPRALLVKKRSKTR